jgi:curved DNA-binding protein CbpA
MSDEQAEAKGSGEDARAKQNHYQVLGLERGADDRAIKKAYFGLIRKFPPDTHPEEFKDLRHAYEVLSDPVARKRFDDAARDYREYGDDAALALREAEAEVKAGDEKAAQTRLRALVDERPDLRIARENLAASLSRTKDFAPALAELDTLLEAAPEEPRYHLFRGLVLRGMEKPKKAKAALRKAHDLAPADLGIHVALIDLLADEKAFDEALDEITGALPGQMPRSAGALRLWLRKISVLVLADRGRGAEAAITELIAEVERSGDAELPRYVAAQLAAIAAGCFARKEAAAANALLRRCAELHPESPVHHPFPPIATIAYADLPEPGRRWLAKVESQPESGTLARTIWTLPVFAFVCAVGLAALTAFILFDAPEPWTAGSLAGAASAIAVATAALSLSLRWILRILGSPLRAFVTLHPLYIVNAIADRIDLYPLPALTNVQAVHHHTNGVYTHTLVTLWFEARSLQITHRGRQAAERWVGWALGCRKRTLELMMAGYLEAEEGVELIPPALLSRPRPLGERPWAGSRRWIAGTAATALVAWGAAVPLHARLADDEAWSRAARTGALDDVRGYVAARPSGRHAGEAAREVTLAAARAEASLRAVSDARAPGAAALHDALAAAVAGGSTRVPLILDLPSAGGIQGPGSSHFGALAARLNAVLEAAGLGRMMILAPAAEAGSARVALFVHAAAAAGGRLTGDARLVIAGADAFTWSATVGPDDVPVPDDAVELTALASKLSVALGLGGVADAVGRSAAPVPSPSPYRPTRPGAP